MFLSQKVDDSDERIQSLEDKLSAQELTINNLKNEVNDASSFHRYLQSADSDCLPRFQDTAFGPRCDFSYVMRFQNRTFFNDDVVFNENVEFDSDANCMPTYNSTSKMCTLNNNFTFDMGDITFNHSVEFDDDVEFTDSARFRDPVRFDSDVDFLDNGEVTFKKKVEFEDDVHMSNDDHNIEFRIDEKVTVRFYQDDGFKIDTYTTYYDDVKMEEDLQIKKKLTVKGKSYLDDVEAYGWVWIDRSLTVEGQFKANHRAIVKGGLHVQTGGLDVTHGADIRGGLQVSHDAKINGKLNVTNGVEVNGGLDADSAQIGATAISRRLQSGNGVDNDGVLLKVFGGVDVSFLLADYVKDVIELYAKSVTADNATFGGVSYSPPNIDIDIDINIDEIVNKLMVYDKEVMIPNLKAVDFDVISAVGTDGTKPGSMTYHGVDVMTEISTLTNMVNDLPTGSAEEASCSCGETEISLVVNVAYMEKLVNEDYVQKLGFAKEDTVNKAIADVKDENLATLSKAESVPSSCECGLSDIESVVTYDYLQRIVNDSYVGDLGFASKESLNDVQGQIKGVVDEMDTISCECDIEAFVNDKGFITMDELTPINNDIKEMKEKSELESDSAPPSCVCESSKIEEVVNGMEFATLSGLDETNNNIVTINDNIGTINENIGTVNDNIVTINQNIDTINENIDTIGSDTDGIDIQSVVTEEYVKGLLVFDDNNISLDDKISNLEGDIGTLQVDVDSKADSNAITTVVNEYLDENGPICDCPSDTEDTAGPVTRF